MVNTTTLPRPLHASTDPMSMVHVRSLWRRLEGPRRIRVAAALLLAGACSLWTCFLDRICQRRVYQRRRSVALIAYEA